jgi:hypothetical protein
MFIFKFSDNTVQCARYGHLKMGKVPKKPSKVSTPGSYNIKSSKGNVPTGKASSVSKGKASNRSKRKATSGKSTPSK